MYINELDATELITLLKKEKVRLVDVRTPKEIEAGIIPNAQAMPMSVLAARMNELPKNEQIIIYCRTGARSAQVCMYMSRFGYDKVYNLRGGIVSWASNNQPIIPGSEALEKLRA
jgi:rhodanese-related sulfurtransferase